MKIKLDIPSFLTVLFFMSIGVWSMTTFLKDKLSNWAESQPIINTNPNIQGE